VPEDEEPPRIIDRRSSQKPDVPGPSNGEVGEKEQTLQEQQSTESLAEQLAQEKERAESYLASWQRSAADFQNYKRRVEGEREEISRLANAALIINLLPLMDDLERALDSVDSRLAGMTWLDGVRLIHRKFQAVLEMNGVSLIETDGQDFDPNVHEAVTFGPGEENKIIGVVQKGYRLGGRVLRPALVVVGKSSEPSTT
jgi:molecular chaperone GrpE